MHSGYLLCRQIALSDTCPSWGASRAQLGYMAALVLHAQLRGPARLHIEEDRTL